MTVIDALLQTFARKKTTVLSIKQLYTANRLINRSTIRSSLSRAFRKGLINKVDKGIYSYEYFTYKEYLHAKRIYDTHKSKPQHDFDLDIELTATGLAPESFDMVKIDKIINPKLLDRGLELLSEEGIYLFERMIDFHVSGSQWLRKTTLKYKSEWRVEIKFVNNIGGHYVFEGFFYVAESEWG